MAGEIKNTIRNAWRSFRKYEPALITVTGTQVV
jgi:hypothetical protein